jgi:hypothetical protein
VVAYYAVRAILALGKLLPMHRSVASASLFALCMVWPVHDTVRLVSELNHDTRATAQARFKFLGGPILAESYVSPKKNRGLSAAALSWRAIRESGARYIAVSSFAYDRYLIGETLWWQTDSVYRRARRYRALFACPYIEIRPDFKAFAFSNPTIRIIDLAGCPRDFQYPS